MFKIAEEGDWQPKPPLSSQVSGPSKSPTTPFAPLTQALSHLSVASPPRDDGFDNYPPPLPGSPVQLQRVLTDRPDIERQMASSDPTIGPPPDGGRDAWLCVASAFFILFCIFGFVTSFGQLEAWYIDHQLKGYTRSQISWIASVQTFFTFCGSLFAGRWFDAHGTRLLVVIGLLLSTGAIVGMAFCQKYWEFMLAHLAFGMSGSLFYSPATAIAGHWFLRRRATAVGIVAAGSGLAGVIYPIMMQNLWERIGFRNGMLVIAATNAVLMVPSYFFMKARLPPRSPPPLSALKGPWKDTRYVFLVIGSCFMMMNFPSPYFNAPVLSASNHLSANLREYSVAILQTGSFIGRCSSGFLADRFGVWNTFIVFAYAEAVCMFAFWLASPLPSAAVVVGEVWYGVASGGWITLVAATCATISPVKEFGMRLGMLWTVTAFPLFAGPAACGALVTMADNKFTYAAIFCGVGFLFGASLSNAPRIWEVTRARTKQTDLETSQIKEDKERPMIGPTSVRSSRQSSRTLANDEERPTILAASDTSHRDTHDHRDIVT